MFVVLAMAAAGAAEVCTWQTSFASCKGNDTAKVCEPTKFDGTAPSDAEARHACYEARATPPKNGWTKEQVADCVVQCAAAAPVVLPTIALQEGASPELRAALYRARQRVAECVAASGTHPTRVTVSATVANGTVRVSRVEGVVPTLGDCIGSALQATGQAGPDGGATITLTFPPKPQN